MSEYTEKQPHRSVLCNRCSENMQQIYRRTPMQKCDFNKVAKQPLDGCFCIPLYALTKVINSQGNVYLHLKKITDSSQFHKNKWKVLSTSIGLTTNSLKA